MAQPLAQAQALCLFPDRVITQPTSAPDISCQKGRPEVHRPGTNANHKLIRIHRYSALISSPLIFQCQGCMLAAAPLSSFLLN